MRTRQTSLGLVPVAEFAKRSAMTVDDYITSAQGAVQIKGASIASGVSEESIEKVLREFASKGVEATFEIRGPRGAFTIVTRSDVPASVKPSAQSAI